MLTFKCNRGGENFKSILRENGFKEAENNEPVDFSYWDTYSSENVDSKIMLNDLKLLISIDNKEYLYEIHKRIFKPLFIPIISILCCFILYTNQEKINLNKLKIFIFSISTLLIIFIEVLLNLSIKNILFQYSLYIIPLLLPILLILILANFLKNEPIYK